MRRAVLAIAIIWALPSSAHAETCMEALGAVHSANLFNTYTAIGAVADGFSRDTYTKDDVRDLMATQTAFIDVLSKSLTTVDADVGTTSPDRKTIAKLQEIYRLLKSEAMSLRAYSQSKKKSDLAAYDDSRARAWVEIEALLGLTAPGKKP